MLSSDLSYISRGHATSLVHTPDDWNWLFCDKSCLVPTLRPSRHRINQPEGGCGVGSSCEVDYARPWWRCAPRWSADLSPKHRGYDLSLLARLQQIF
jgi:hypothetical protein